MTSHSKLKFSILAQSLHNGLHPPMVQNLWGQQNWWGHKLVGLKVFRGKKMYGVKTKLGLTNCKVKQMLGSQHFWGSNLFRPSEKKFNIWANEAGAHPGRAMSERVKCEMT